jgi:hypothetical protein
MAKGLGHQSQVNCRGNFRQGFFITTPTLRQAVNTQKSVDIIYISVQVLPLNDATQTKYFKLTYN